MMNELRGTKRELKLSKQDYLTDDYFTYKQLWSFIEQIYHINKLKPSSMLEIGVGNGFVASFFRQIGFEVTTVDINGNLNPDIILPVEKIGKNFQNTRFDLITCCEVLEHIPFELFEKIITDLSTISDKLFLTLPMHNRFLGFGGYLKLPVITSWIGVWLVIPKKFKLSEQHYWEINSSKYTRKKRIIELLNKHYKTVETGLFKANPVHRYFICKR